MIRRNGNVFFIHLLATILLASSMQAHAKVCPEENYSKDIKAVYVKYKITDELWSRINKENGAPSDVRGDELEELIVWKDYKWKRLYGRTWNIDKSDYSQLMDNYHKKMDEFIKKQEQGMDVDAEVEKLSIELMNYKPKSEVEEYDRITVKIPEYVLHYNASNKTGYGYKRFSMSASERKRLGSDTRSQIDTWINSNFKDTNSIFGFKKISSKTSQILGHEVTCETIKTSFNDFQRSYDQIEICKANITGYEVVLYEKTGSSGDSYVTQAVEVNLAYPVKKDRFCAPDYVKMKTS
jgi:hypothetical protein